MYKGGSTYSKKMTKLLQFTGLLVPILLIIYGLLIQFDIIKSAHPLDNFTLIVFTFGWMFISSIELIKPRRSKLDTGLRLTAYHVLSALYLIFISGLASPIAAFWLLLMIASYYGFTDRGLQFSTLGFAIVALIDILLWQNINGSIVTSDLMILVIILIIGLVTMTLSKTQQRAKAELAASKAQEALQRDRVLTIINNMSDAVFSTDTKGVIRVYNASSLNLLDTNIDLNGREIDDVLKLTDQENSKISILDQLANTKTVQKRDDLDYSYDDGEKIRLEITFSPIRSSFSKSKKTQTRDGYIIIMRDVTKAKSLEEERDEFISVVSHELRTPITIAEGTISNVQMMMDHPDITNDMLKNSINLAHDQVIFLASMVNDLSTLSRAERGVADSAEDIDVRELAHKLIVKYTDEANERGLHLDLDIQSKVGSVRASRLYLEELLQNLITNSLKYTKKGSVTIIIKKESGNIKFSIKDTGIGISKTDQIKIFNKFYRSEDYRTRETGGTGLGLYIAAKLSKKLGTKIQMTSRLNFGSTFSITLKQIEASNDIKNKTTDHA
jgi:PAS domain S-box-containing protein